jgi:hypothetical protein
MHHSQYSTAGVPRAFRSRSVDRSAGMNLRAKKKLPGLETRQVCHRLSVADGRRCTRSLGLLQRIGDGLILHQGPPLAVPSRSSRAATGGLDMT